MGSLPETWAQNYILSGGFTRLKSNIFVTKRAIDKDFKIY